jgi:hypothetical protein
MQIDESIASTRARLASLHAPHGNPLDLPNYLKQQTRIA